MKSVYIAVTATLAAISGPLQAAENSAPAVLEEVTIIGSSEEALKITGSAHYIGKEQLQEFSYSDIQRIAREVPGVSLQIEDGYGLRPNISIRGVATERSGRITLLEDNVLIAPAPYSAPSAYYFPTVGRMSAVEVLKGPAAITQGPYTIGGALNMVSTPIPQENSGNVMTELGEDATRRVHATYGGRLSSGFGFLFETHHWDSDGFQDIDRSSSDTGLDVEDYTVKLSYAPEGSPHSIELKLQYADQDSNQSYLGLTDADFSRNAFRRYGLSELDNIETEHEQQILHYQYDLSDEVSLFATAYSNDHSRNWFKTEGIDFDGSPNAQDFSRTSWNSVVTAINNNSMLSGFTSAELQGILDGTLDTPEGSIQVRSNDREYFSRGIQFGANWAAQAGGVDHAIEIGVRIHEDEEDRLQRNSTYSQVAGTLQLDDFGELGNAGNRVQGAEAVSLYIYDQISIDRLTLSPGLRYENIDQKRTRYRDGAARSFRDSRKNDTKVWLPGLGFLYQVSDSLVLVGGAHKGFTAPSNSPGVDEEEAINYEFGFRVQDENLNVELIGFLSDYDNLLGECTSSSGSDCTIGDAFNGDAATVQGVEFLLSTDLSQNSALSIPLSFTYTYIEGEFDTDVADTDFFGDVSKGDPIPYLPESQYQVSLGLQSGNWAAYLNGSYIDEVCVRASCGAFEKTDDSFTLDISTNYRLSDALTVFGRVENLTGEEDIMGRQPYGARPNKDTTASVGVRFNF